MDKKELIALANEVFVYEFQLGSAQFARLERFATIVADKEREAIRMRDISALADALEAANQQVEALSSELLTPHVFCRLVEWLRDPKPATAAFTAGIERQIAYALEVDVLPEVKSLRIRLANRDARIAELEEKVQAVVDRWETPLWKDVPSTAIYIYALRDTLNKHKG